LKFGRANCVDCHFHRHRSLRRVPDISTYKHIKCYNEHVHHSHLASSN